MKDGMATKTTTGMNSERRRGKPSGGKGATDTGARQCKAARALYGWAGRHGTVGFMV